MHYSVGSPDKKQHTSKDLMAGTKETWMAWTCGTAPARLHDSPAFFYRVFFTGFFLQGFFYRGFSTGVFLQGFFLHGFFYRGFSTGGFLQVFLLRGPQSC